MHRIEVITVYAIYGALGPRSEVYSSEEAARARVAGSSWNGTATVVPESAVAVGDGRHVLLLKSPDLVALDDMRMTEVAKVREQALAKLTPEERQALGFPV